MEQGI